MLMVFIDQVLNIIFKKVNFLQQNATLKNLDLKEK